MVFNFVFMGLWCVYACASICVDVSCGVLFWFVLLCTFDSCRLMFVFQKERERKCGVSRMENGEDIGDLTGGKS